VEEWIPLQEFPDYSVSSYGRVRSERYNRILAVIKNGRGVAMVTLPRYGVNTKRSLAKLVATAFVEIPEYRIPFDTVIHLDGDNMHNCAHNLMWRPKWFAGLYNRQFKIYPRDTLPLRDCETGEEYEDIWTAIITHGLLYRDLMVCAQDRTPVFPTFQRFEWVI